MLSAPQPLAVHHHLADFDCGEPSLDDWLKRRVAKNQANGSSRTCVVCEGDSVAGDYCLAASAIGHAEAPSTLQRNRPDPVPVLVLGRLAIHKHRHQQGIGTALLNDAIRRAMQAADIAGVTALLVHAFFRASPALLPVAWLHRVARQAHDHVPDAGHGRAGIARAVVNNAGASVAPELFGDTTRGLLIHLDYHGFICLHWSSLILMFPVRANRDALARCPGHRRRPAICNGCPGAGKVP